MKRNTNHIGRYLLALTIALFVGLSFLPNPSLAYLDDDLYLFEMEEGLDILGPDEVVLDFGIEDPLPINRLSRFTEENLDILAPGEVVLHYGVEDPLQVLDYGEEDPSAGMLIAPRSNIGTIRYAGGGHTGGTVPAQHTLTVPGSATLRQPGTMVRSGHTFAGWRSSASGNIFAAGATVVFTNPGTTTYTAVWNANNALGTIRYAGGGHTGGTVPAQHTLNVPGSATLRQPGTMVRSGHTFAGWRSSASGNVFAAGATVTFTNPGTTTYTAVWTATNNVGTIRYAGGGHTGGTVPAQHTLNVPGSATLRQPGTMVRSGHTFAGWRSSASGNVFSAGATVVFNNPGTTTYTAVWTVAGITLTFDPNDGGGRTTSISIQAGAAIRDAQLPTPARLGRQFVDWFNTSAVRGGTRIRGGATFNNNTTVWARWNDPSRHLPYWTRPANSGTTTINYRIINNPNATWTNRMISGATAWNNSAARVNFMQLNSSSNTVSLVATGLSGLCYRDQTGTRLNSFRIVLSAPEVNTLALESGERVNHVAQYIMAHEFGHAIGLRDNPTLTGSQRSVMTQRVIRPEVELIITQFDVDSVNMIY